MRSRDIDKKYGKLTLLHKARAGGAGVGTLWVAVCDCGTTKEVLLRKVRSGDVQSCGKCTRSLGIRPDERVVHAGIPKGHKRQFSNLIRQKPQHGVTAARYLEIARNRCIACNVQGCSVEWAYPADSASTELVAICGACSLQRRGQNVSKWLEWILRTATRINDRLSSSIK